MTWSRGESENRICSNVSCLGRNLGLMRLIRHVCRDDPLTVVVLGTKIEPDASTHVENLAPISHAGTRHLHVLASQSINITSSSCHLQVMPHIRHGCCVHEITETLGWCCERYLSWLLMHGMFPLPVFTSMVDRAEMRRVPITMMQLERERRKRMRSGLMHFER